MCGRFWFYIHGICFDTDNVLRKHDIYIEAGVNLVYVLEIKLRVDDYIICGVC